MMKRCKEEIILEILDMCASGASKTALIGKANLNSDLATRYVDHLCRGGLLEIHKEGSSVVYLTTSEGMETIGRLREMQDLLRILNVYIKRSCI